MKTNLNEIGSLKTAAVIFVILVIALVVGAEILTSLHDTQETTQSDTIINETFTGVQVGINQNFTYNPVTSVSIIINTTSDTVSTGNYTVATTTWVLDTYEHENETLNVTYVWTRTVTSVEGNVSTEGLDALVDFSDWLAILVIVVISVVIMGLIIRSFSKTGI